MFDTFYKKFRAFLREEKNLLHNNKKTIFGNFAVKINEDFTYRVTLFNKQGVVQIIQAHLDEFVMLPFYRDIMDLLSGSKNIKQINMVINICYFDMHIFAIMPDYKKMNFICLPAVRAILVKKFNRARLFEVNKNAITFDASTKNELYQKLLKKGFDFIEIPSGFSYSKIHKLTSEISTLMSKKGVKDFNISLRIKKLGLYRTNGFYSKETNTMFLDPRHLWVWRHELAHYFVAKHGLCIEDEESFADNF